MAGASRPSVGGHASMNTDGAKALGRGHGLLILELSHVERDIEEYFVELMGGADA